MMYDKTHTGRWAGLALLLCLVSACAMVGQKKGAALTPGIQLYGPMSVEELARLPPAEQTRYFTDNVYFAATNRGGAGEARAEAASVALRHLQDSLNKEDFLRFWIGVDGDFFGRVNAALEFPDYTRPQAAPDQRRVRTAYNLAARHLEVVKNLGEARQRAMGYLIELASKGGSEPCFAFHKAYKDYSNPLHADTELTWPQVDGKPFRKSMWAGSGEATVGGKVVRIAIPAEVVLGCRTILHPPATVTAGLVEDVKQFFAGIKLGRDFNVAGYNQRKEAWRRDITQQALSAAEKLRVEKFRIVNVVDVYQIYPPEQDYEYELAAGNGSLPERVAAGILGEQDAFVVEQRIHERAVLLTGVGITPQGTPMAFLHMVSDRAPKK